jgi:hypothetical protein
MLNIVEDKQEIDDTGLTCVLRVGTLSELWRVTLMAVDGDYDASKITIYYVDTGERDPGMRPVYNIIYDAHFTAKAGDVIVMYPNAIVGRRGSRFFEVTDRGDRGLHELSNQDEVLQVLAKSGRVEPIEEYA